MVVFLYSMIDSLIYWLSRAYFITENVKTSLAITKFTKWGDTEYDLC